MHYIMKPIEVLEKLCHTGSTSDFGFIHFSYIILVTVRKMLLLYITSVLLVLNEIHILTRKFRKTLASSFRSYNLRIKF